MDLRGRETVPQGKRVRGGGHSWQVDRLCKGVELTWVQVFWRSGGDVRGVGDSLEGKSRVRCTREMGRFLGWGVRGLAGCCVGHGLERRKEGSQESFREQGLNWRGGCGVGKKGYPNTLQDKCRVGC